MLLTGCSALEAMDLASTGPKMAELHPITTTLDARVVGVKRSAKEIFTPLLPWLWVVLIIVREKLN